MRGNLPRSHLIHELLKTGVILAAHRRDRHAVLRLTKKPNIIRLDCVFVVYPARQRRRANLLKDQRERDVPLPLHFHRVVNADAKARKHLQAVGRCHPMPLVAFVAHLHGRINALNHCDVHSIREHFRRFCPAWNRFARNGLHVRRADVFRIHTGREPPLRKRRVLIIAALTTAPRAPGLRDASAQGFFCCQSWIALIAQCCRRHFQAREFGAHFFNADTPLPSHPRAFFC